MSEMLEVKPITRKCSDVCWDAMYRHLFLSTQMTFKNTTLNKPQHVFRLFSSCFLVSVFISTSERQQAYNKTVYVEIKCQLDATEVFIADLNTCSTCFWHHYAHGQELKSIIQWLLPVVFRAVVFKLLVWCGAEGYVSGLQDAAAGLIRPSSGP